MVKLSLILNVSNEKNLAFFILYKKSLVTIFVYFIFLTLGEDLLISGGFSSVFMLFHYYILQEQFYFICFNGKVFSFIFYYLVCYEKINAYSPCYFLFNIVQPIIFLMIFFLSVKLYSSAHLNP